MDAIPLKAKFGEARLILPLYGPDAVPLDGLRLTLATTLCSTFGGFTSFHGSGAWVDPAEGVIAEPVVIYDIAMHATTENAERLATIAGWAARVGRQKCVYVRFACGTVELVEPSADDTAFTPPQAA